MRMTTDMLRMSEVAKGAGVSVQTVRYYERRGLLPEPPRSASNYRVYPAGAVRRVRFIKRAQALGFSLREVAELLALDDAPQVRCAAVRVRAQAKVHAIESRLRALQAMRRALTKLIAECVEQEPVSRCPILEALDTQD